MNKYIKSIFGIIIFIITINLSICFASYNSQITVDDIKTILKYYNPDGYNKDLYTDERLEDLVTEANETENGILYYGNVSGRNTLTLQYDFIPQVRGVEGSEYFNGTRRNYIQFDEYNNTYKKDISTFGNQRFSTYLYLYCIGGWENTTNPNNGVVYSDGWTNNNDIIFFSYPYFEFNDKLINDTAVFVDGYGNSYSVKKFENINFNEAIGKIYCKEVSLLEGVSITKFKKNSKGQFSSSNSVIKNLYKVDELVEGYYFKYVRPVEENGEFLYYDVYLPENFIEEDCMYFIGFSPSPIEDIQERLDKRSFYFSRSSNSSNSPGFIGGYISGDFSGDLSGDDFSLEDSTNMITNKIEEATNGIIDGLLNGIKSLFIPTEEQMSEWLTDTQTRVTERLGILGEPINFFSRLMGKLVVSEDKDFIISIPDFIIPGSNYLLIEAFDINLSEMIRENDVFNTIYTTYMVIISGITAYAFLSYLWSFYDYILGSRDIESSYKIVEEVKEEHEVREKIRNKRPIGFRQGGMK